MKTRSETLFERFLVENRISYSRHPVVEHRRTPDYRVAIAGVEVILEVKEINGAWNNEFHTGVVGKHIRKKINRAKGQMRCESQKGKSTVLLIFNNYDPKQLFGTENHDFKHAMYGVEQLRIKLDTLKIVDRFHGSQDSFQLGKNTSISALGRIKEGARNAPMTVTLFENMHAAVPLDFARFPPCFEVIRFKIS